MSNYLKPEHEKLSTKERLDIIESFIEKEPENIDRILQDIKFETMHDRSEYKYGIAILKKHIDKVTDENKRKRVINHIETILFNTGQMFYNDYNFEKAFELYDEVISYNGDFRGSAWKMKGQIYREESEYDKSTECFLNIGKKHIFDEFDMNYEVGINYMLERNAEKGIPYMERAHELRPDDYTCMVELGVGYYMNKAYQKAIYIYQKAMEIKNDDYELYYHLALAYGDSGDELMSAHYNKKCLELKPDYAPAMMNFAAFYNNSEDDVEECLRLTHEAVDKDDSPDFQLSINYNLYILYNKMKDIEKAKYHINKAFDLYMKNPSEFDHLDIIFMMTVEWAKINNVGMDGEE